MPDTAELLENPNKAAKQELSRSAERWVDAFVRLLETDAPALASHPMGIPAIAEFFYSASMNAKNHSETRAVLEPAARRAESGNACAGR